MGHKNESSSSFSDRSTPPEYALLDPIGIAEYAGLRFLYDRESDKKPIVHVPTQPISRRVHDVIAALRRANPANRPWSEAKIKAIFAETADRETVDLLIKHGYLELRDDKEATGEARKAFPPDERLGESYREHIEGFDRNERRHFFRPAALFNAPPLETDSLVQVGFVGVPFASINVAAGTALGPAYLRMMTQAAYHWLDLSRDGCISEAGLNGDKPGRLCRGAVLKDYGDLANPEGTVNGLFEAVAAWVDETMMPNGIRPFFVGGDHAITFPIVHALLQHFPDLRLIHLDAHNDLFYCESLYYSHAGPISNLLVYSELSGGCSFGLRTYCDGRVNKLRLADDPRITDRMRLYSLASTKRLLAEPARFAELLKQNIPAGAPCYLTIDLDVLSAQAIGSRLSTPAGAGLEWWELLETTRIVFENLNVIGCDLTELNPANGNEAEFRSSDLTALTLHLIHGLAAKGPLPTG